MLWKFGLSQQTTPYIFPPASTTSYTSLLLLLQAIMKKVLVLLLTKSTGVPNGMYMYTLWRRWCRRVFSFWCRKRQKPVADGCRRLLVVYFEPIISSKFVFRSSSVFAPTPDFVHDDGVFFYKAQIIRPSKNHSWLSLFLSHTYVAIDRMYV